ncbi:Retrovirus-related Pol polyprotein from transposon TNT 1-94 [Vitis vinifera]|uniref:Retrovirus-related Pol polyprotein from transposon TNT 1-94 n=1 Tax=Vitis vinifera TaxID=29760 RepID=A0A438HYK5_VITVI|nr:Retrovirus-related Pol polyprotein from transposon TNT 1-94 [Vitis vinifera]
MVQNQFNSKIQVLKLDNAKEYFTSSLSTYLQNHGIIHISSCVDTPQQNGVAERKNRHLLEVARCLMFSSNVPNYFWGEAILTATYLINHMPSRVLTFQSPRQLLLKKFPHTRATSSDFPLKVFGCTTFVHVYPHNRSKFAPRANKCIFLGVTNPSQSAPIELSTPMPSSVQSAQPTNVPSPVTIQSPMPIQPIAPQLANENLQSTEENIGEDRAREVLIPSIDDSTLPIALRKGVKRCTDHPIGNYVTYEGLSPSYRAFATSLDDTQVPNTIQEAFKISEWKKAVQDEIDALEKNGTWTITDLPVGKRPVGCKWIFTIKYKADGSIKRFKARLVARGFTQSYGIDYQETFAPVAKLNTIRILLSLAVNQDWCLQQLDIKNAFLNGDLEEEVYMEIPPGFEGSMAKNQETGMLGCKPIDTPMDSQKKLGIEKESTPVDRGRYQRLVGRLIYLSHTRPDVGFAMSAKTENRDTEVYSDADWVGNIIDRQSTSGYCSFVSGNLVTWRSKKQSVVARSRAECHEMLQMTLPMAYIGAISIAKNPVHHDRTKHVEIDRHFITEKVTSETVKLNYVPTKHQTADILTKLYLGLTSKT